MRKLDPKRTGKISLTAFIDFNREHIVWHSDSIHCFSHMSNGHIWMNKIRKYDQRGDSNFLLIDSIRSLLLRRVPSRRVGRGRWRKFLKTRLFSRYAYPKRLRSKAWAIFLVSLNCKFCVPSKNGLSNLSVSLYSPFSYKASGCLASVNGEALTFLSSSNRLKVGDEASILSSRILARELLCFYLFPLEPFACFSTCNLRLCLRKRSPSDLEDFTDLLSLDSTLEVSL